jgi:hypothetical protein
VSAKPKNATETVELQLKAIDIDVRCSLAISLALLRGLAATSDQARHALDAALDEELQLIAPNGSHTDAAVHGIVSEARAQLRVISGFQDRLARELERAIVESADQLPDEAEAGALRSCA